MRTIKFKIYYQHDETWRIIHRIIYLGQFFHSLPRWSKIGKCQFIGLLDKKGNEIYEGDIIKIYGSIALDDPAFGFHEFKYEVCFDALNSQFSTRSKNVNYPKRIDGYTYFNGNLNGEIEIIGNIYENPELLK